MNEEKKELTIRLAKEAGFSDARAAACEGGTLFFLFTPYRPAPRAEYGKINLSNYYIASQNGYHAMKKMIARLDEAGIRAAEFRKHEVKRLALETGGFQGFNTLYYHEQHGSFTAIHALETDFICAPDRPSQQTACLRCGNCISACPAGAITASGFSRERCVRNYMCEKQIPAEYGKFIYQLLGCERCQSACPYNETEPGEAFSYDITEVIGGKHTKEIAGLVGPNYGRRRIVVGQAVIYAANMLYTPALPAIEAVGVDEFVGEAARYAAEILKKR